MFKKSLALILALLFVLAISGCKKKTETSSKPDNDSSLSENSDLEGIEAEIVTDSEIGSSVTSVTAGGNSDSKNPSTSTGDKKPSASIGGSITTSTSSSASVSDTSSSDKEPEKADGGEYFPGNW